MARIIITFRPCKALSMSHITQRNMQNYHSERYPCKFTLCTPYNIIQVSPSFQKPTFSSHFLNNKKHHISHTTIKQSTYSFLWIKSPSLPISILWIQQQNATLIQEDSCVTTIGENGLCRSPFLCCSHLKCDNRMQWRAPNWRRKCFFKNFVCAVGSSGATTTVENGLCRSPFLCCSHMHSDNKMQQRALNCCSHFCCSPKWTVATECNTGLWFACFLASVFSNDFGALHLCGNFPIVQWCHTPDSLWRVLFSDSLRTADVTFFWHQCSFVLTQLFWLSCSFVLTPLFFTFFCEFFLCFWAPHSKFPLCVFLVLTCCSEWVSFAGGEFFVVMWWPKNFFNGAFAALSSHMETPWVIITVDFLQLVTLWPCKKSFNLVNAFLAIGMLCHWCALHTMWFSIHWLVKKVVKLFSSPLCCCDWDLTCLGLGQVGFSVSCSDGLFEWASLVHF